MSHGQWGSPVGVAIFVMRCICVVISAEFRELMRQSNVFDKLLGVFRNEVCPGRRTDKEYVI